MSMHIEFSNTFKIIFKRNGSIIKDKVTMQIYKEFEITFINSCFQGHNYGR
jgi:hypothetical protein